MLGKQILFHVCLYTCISLCEYDCIEVAYTFNKKSICLESCCFNSLSYFAKEIRRSHLKESILNRNRVVKESRRSYSLKKHWDNAFSQLIPFSISTHHPFIYPFAYMSKYASRSLPKVKPQLTNQQERWMYFINSFSCLW